MRDLTKAELAKGIKILSQEPSIKRMTPLGRTLFFQAISAKGMIKIESPKKRTKSRRSKTRKSRRRKKSRRSRTKSRRRRR